MFISFITPTDAESPDCTGTLDDINEEDDFCEGVGEDEEFFEEELTDLEEDSEELCGDSSGEEVSGLEPLTCLQKMENNLGARERLGSGSDVRRLQSVSGARRLCADVDSSGELQNWRLKLLDSGRAKGSSAVATASGNLDDKNEFRRERECTTVCSPSARGPEDETQTLEQLKSRETSTTSSPEQSATCPSVTTAAFPLKTQGLSTIATPCTHGLRDGEQPSPPLSPSLFPGVPPAIHFPLHDEKCRFIIVLTYLE